MELGRDLSVHSLEMRVLIGQAVDGMLLVLDMVELT